MAKINCFCNFVCSSACSRFYFLPYLIHKLAYNLLLSFLAFYDCALVFMRDPSAAVGVSYLLCRSIMVVVDFYLWHVALSHYEDIGEKDRQDDDR